MRHRSKLLRLPLATLAISLLLIQTVSAATGSINAVDVRFRSTPGTTSAGTILKLLAKGTSVEILKTEGDWYQVSLNGTNGYVYSKYVTKNPAPVPAVAAVSAQPAAPVPVAASPAADKAAAPATSPADPAVVAATPAVSPVVPVTATTAAPVQGAEPTVVSATASPVEPAGLATVETPLKPDPAPSTTESGAARQNRVVVEATALNIRQAATAESTLLGRLVYGVEVLLLEQAGGWSKIRTDSGLEGYVLAQYLASVDTTVSRGSSELVDELIASALSLQGVKYVYGSMSLNGFDCSGFVKYVYEGIGVSTPRSSRDYGAVGTRVAREALVPGDVLLWDTDGSRVTNISHVGIYLGNDKYVHASTTLGKVVIASVSGYRATYMGARRFLD